jgi:hypothetical protein
MEELQQTQRACRGLSRYRARRDEMRQREELDLGPPVERLQPWSLVALAQGGYLALMGAWPLLHLRSFEKMTGRKRDGRLTQVVGACWLNVGIHLIRTAVRGGRPRRDERGLALRMAATFAACDFHYASRGRRISHLVDGFVQLGFLALWGVTSIAERRALRRPPIAAHA